MAFAKNACAYFDACNPLKLPEADAHIYITHVLMSIERHVNEKHRHIFSHETGVEFVKWIPCGREFPEQWGEKEFASTEWLIRSELQNKFGVYLLPSPMGKHHGHVWYFGPVGEEYPEWKNCTSDYHQICRKYSNK